MAGRVDFMDFGGLQEYLEMEAGNRIELLMRDLQSRALPLC